MKIGLLLAVYKDSEYIQECLAPWIKLKKDYDIEISVCHGLFKEYHENGVVDDDKETLNILYSLKIDNKIDYLYVQNNYGLDFTYDVKKYENEAQIRNNGLKYLLSKNIDYLWTIGADEIYKEHEIINILNFIKSNKLYSYFKINYKNFVFDKNQYIDNFCPPRIWNNKINDKIKEFYWDDDIVYNNLVDYKQTSFKIIPKNVAFPDHFTWLSDDRSKNKVKYQESHFKNGYGCSFRWDNDKLEWNEDFFIKTNQKIPEIKTIC